VRSWGLSVLEQEELWRRWRQGESLRLIARRMGRRGPSVRAFVLQTGGVQRHPPRRAKRCLSMAEREEISRGVAAGEPCRQIAARLGRAPSTVSRELARNGGRACYRAPSRRRRGLPAGPAAQAGQASLGATAPPGGRGQAGAAMVTPADRRLAAAVIAGVWAASQSA
jgi:DNA-binding CsgD family transcriptional regulator